MFTSQPYRVYVYDTDVAGVVHHSNYLRYFEAGRIEFLRELGYPYIKLQHAGIGLIPINISIKYKKPLREDDEYQVTVKIIQIKKASFTIEQTVINNSIMMVTGIVQLACVQEPEFKPIGLPALLYTTLTSL